MASGLIRRFVAIVSIVMAAVAIDAPPAAAVSPVDLRAAAQNVLDTRVDAIVKGNRTAYANTIDPKASEAFRAAELTKYDGARSVPLVGLQMNVDTSETGDLNAGLDLAKQHGSDLAYLPKTTRTYRLGTFDTLPAVDEFFYTYVQRAGRWYVAADNDLESLGLQNAPSLFDFGPVVTTQSTHFLVLASAQNADRAKDLDGIAEEGMTVLASRLKLSWSERIPILVPDSPQQAADLLRTTNDVANFVAFVGYTPLREDTTYSITAPRVFSQEKNLAAQARERQVSTFTHELTHAATAPQGGPFTSTWIHEGLAEYVRQGRPAVFAYPSGTKAVPDAGAFSTSGTSLTNAYQASTSAMTLVARIGGADAPERLFLALGKRRITPGTPAYNIDVAMQNVLGMGLTEFQAKWLA